MVSRISYIYFIVFFVFLFGLSPQASYNLPPQQTVERLIHTIKSLNTSSSLSSREIKANQKVSHLALTLIDLDEISRKALGKYWTKRTPTEKKEFRLLLSRMFVQEAFPSSGKFFLLLKLVFGKTKIEQSKALVPITLTHEEEGEIAINFHLHKSKGKWKIVDVYLDEVSMRNNLRSQVYKIISKNDYQELVRRIKEKLKNSNS